MFYKNRNVENGDEKVSHSVKLAFYNFFYNFSYNSQKRQFFLQQNCLKEILSFFGVVGKVVDC